MRYLCFNTTYAFNLLFGGAKIERELETGVCFGQLFCKLANIVDEEDNPIYDDITWDSYVVGSLDIILRKTDRACCQDNMYCFSEKETNFYLKYLQDNLCEFTYTIEDCGLYDLPTSYAARRFKDDAPRSAYKKLRIIIKAEHQTSAMQLKCLCTLVRYLYEAEYAIQLHDALYLRRILKYRNIPFTALMGICVSIYDYVGTGHCYLPALKVFLKPTNNLYEHKDAYSYKVANCCNHLEGKALPLDLKRKIDAANLSKHNLGVRIKKDESFDYEKCYESVDAAIDEGDLNDYTLYLSVKDRNSKNRRELLQQVADEYLIVYKNELTTK